MVQNASHLIISIIFWKNWIKHQKASHFVKLKAEQVATQQ